MVALVSMGAVLVALTLPLVLPLATTPSRFVMPTRRSLSASPPPSHHILISQLIPKLVVRHVLHKTCAPRLHKTCAPRPPSRLI